MKESYSSRSAAVEAWKDVVASYANRELTYSTDKLVALAGLAQRFKPSISDVYAAGLWSSFLPYLLSWSRANTDLNSDCRHLKKYLAPSWSLASLDGPIVYFNSPRADDPVPPTHLLKILDVHVETAGGGEFGPVKDAWLSVKGDCTTIIETQEGWKIPTANGPKGLWREDQECSLDEPNKFGGQRTNKHRPDVNLVLLLLARDPRGDPGRYSIFCLILMEVDDRANTYR